MPRPVTSVLFVCTGNIYRSRYAEAYFNHRARELGIRARATSRGLRTDLVTEDLSPFAAEAMRERGIAPESALRVGLPPEQETFHSLAVRRARRLAQQRKLPRTAGKATASGWSAISGFSSSRSKTR